MLHAIGDTRMVRIGTVWDRTVEVFNGRTSILAAIAAPTLFLPSAASAAVTAFAPNNVALSLIATIIVGLVALWGALALTAVASDPATDRAAAYRAGSSALPKAILVVVALIVAGALIVAPAIGLLHAAGFDWAAAQRGGGQETMDAAKAGGFLLYCLVAAIVGVWIGARLFLLYPVVLNERRGIDAFGRSFALTRGLTWKIIGVLILYAIVLVVVLLAVTSVTGLIFRLLLGGGNIAIVQFLAGVVGAVVTAVFGTLQAVFAAQLYIAARDAREGASSVA